MPISLQIALHNDSDTDQLFAYITGLAIQQGARRCFLRPDGRTLYFPSGPPRIGTPLAEDCAIPLGAPGNSVTVTIPQIAGGRVVRGHHFFLYPFPHPFVSRQFREPCVVNCDL